MRGWYVWFVSSVEEAASPKAPVSSAPFGTVVKEEE